MSAVDGSPGSGGGCRGARGGCRAAERGWSIVRRPPKAFRLLCARLLRAAPQQANGPSVSGPGGLENRWAAASGRNGGNGLEAEGSGARSHRKS